MEKKNNNKAIVVLSAIIVLTIVTFGAYVLVDQGVVKLNFDKNVAEEKGETDKQEETKEVEELSVTDGNVLQLFDMAHGNRAIEMSWSLYKQGKMLVSDLDDKYKSYIAAGTYDRDVVSITDTVTMNTSYYVAEEDVKKAYDIVFGEGVYKRMSSISYSCGTLKFDAATNRYSTDLMGCGGMLGQTHNEQIVKAVKYSDRIEITSVVAFYFMESGIYKDKEAKELLTTERVDLSEYVKKHSDNLYHYTYTFKLNKDGFYNYYSIERVN